MGDFIVTLPVLTALRRDFPDTRLEVVGYPGPASLAVAGGLAHACRPIEARGLAGYFARRGDLDPDWAAYLGGFHVIFSYLYDPDGFFEANVKSVSKAQFIVGPHRPDETRSEHVTRQFLAPLQRLGIFDADPIPRLDLNGSGTALENADSGPELALHPGSSSERKNWPEARWAELITMLARTTRLRFLLLGGEAEGARVQRLASLLPPERVEVWSHRPLVELARRLARVTAYLGHDTGPTHLAAALGRPGLVLWGETNHTVWRPNSDRFEALLAGPQLCDLSVDRVCSALQRVLSGLNLSHPIVP